MPRPPCKRRLEAAETEDPRDRASSRAVLIPPELVWAALARDISHRSLCRAAGADMCSDGDAGRRRQIGNHARARYPGTDDVQEESRYASPDSAGCIPV